MTHLPHCERAIADPRKVSLYLLNTGHPDGGSKARFLICFGFDPRYPECLASALLLHARSHKVTRLQKTPFGTNYVLEGELETPDGRNPRARTIWAIDDGSDAPRFVTLVPLKGGRK